MRARAASSRLRLPGDGAATAVLSRVRGAKGPAAFRCFDTRENPGRRAVVTLSCHFVTEAPAFSVVADVAIVKGETPAGDRTWLSFPDGTARREAVHVITDLPHLVVESVFGLDEGLWGTRATRPFRGLRLVTDVPGR